MMYSLDISTERTDQISDLLRCGEMKSDLSKCSLHAHAFNAIFFVLSAIIHSFLRIGDVGNLCKDILVTGSALSKRSLKRRYYS